MSLSAPRSRALQALADELDRDRAGLEDDIVRTTSQTVRVARDDLELGIRRLRAFDQVGPLLNDRDPVGTVAILFAGTATVSNPVATIGAAFLAGNPVVARFPDSRRPWADRFEPLIRRNLGEVRFESGSGRKFLADALNDREVEVVAVFGDDSWASGYEERVRATSTKFVFDGPGKDPFLVLADADIRSAARDAARGGYHNAGQACTSPERVYVHTAVYEDFVTHLVDGTRAQIVGDPADANTDVGPILSERVVARIERQLAQATEAGASVLAGGRVDRGMTRDGRPAAWVHPTVLISVDPALDVMTEETLGPILPVAPVASAEEAVQLASRSQFGLSASVYGGGAAEVNAVGRSHGQVFHNEIWLDHNRRRLHAPYGGRKRSGWVWERDGGEFVRREGVHMNLLEFSRQRCRGASDVMKEPMIRA